ncbi:DNA polymerase III subunit gamma/tau [Marinicrinis sediminis]|uniref:DNA-directed DNA polymerase n=1 Tax=Marinicrinis sediminis TaxID=1652465 RepID=A0ABW5RG50_9BACL
MSHIALYRAWRPQSFRDVVGQKHIIQTLQNALREQRVSHAYLFSGPRGTGKTSAAKIMAKALNCAKGPAAEPCNECEACRRITEGAVMDVQEIDAASNRGVEEIRDIRDRVKYAPTEVRYKVYIIDEVHMLTTEAFNALLKTLEEPPPHVIFILATTEPNRIPATIISRCQRFDFRRVSLEDQTSRILHICNEEQIEVEEQAAAYIARLSDGGMRDALSILDQMRAFADGQITYDLVIRATGGIAADQFKQLAEDIREGQTANVLDRISVWMQEGKSAEQTLEHLIQYYRDLLLIQVLPAGSEVVTDRIQDPALFEDTARHYDRDQIFRMLDTLHHYQTEMKYAPNPQIILELAALKLTTLWSDQGMKPSSSDAQASGDMIHKLENRLNALEMQLKKVLAGEGAAVASASSSTSASSGSRSGSTKSGSPSQTVRKRMNLEPYLAHQEEVKAVLPKWNQVLGQVKQRKITVHAWLVDGEPVSVANGHLLLAFKNTIHRETTEKPMNKQLIEEVLNEVLGQPFQIETTMSKEWEEATQQQPVDQVAEPLEWTAEETDADGAYKEKWINEAIQLFGEDLVTIKDDIKGDE